MQPLERVSEQESMRSASATGGEGTLFDVPHWPHLAEPMQGRVHHTG